MSTTKVFKPEFELRKIMLLDNSDSMAPEYWGEGDPGRLVELDGMTEGLLNALKLSGAKDKFIEAKTLNHGYHFNRGRDDPIRHNAALNELLTEVKEGLVNGTRGGGTLVEPNIRPEIVEYWDTVRAGYKADTLKTSPPLPPSWSKFTDGTFGDMKLVEEIYAINALLRFCYKDACTPGREAGVYVCIVQIGDPALMDNKDPHYEFHPAHFSRNQQAYVNEAIKVHDQLKKLDDAFKPRCIEVMQSIKAGKKRTQMKLNDFEKSKIDAFLAELSQIDGEGLGDFLDTIDVLRFNLDLLTQRKPQPTKTRTDFLKIMYGAADDGLDRLEPGSLEFD